VVNKRFPHGVGKLHAHDRTKSGDPVTNFRRSTRLYLEKTYGHLLPDAIERGRGALDAFDLQVEGQTSARDSKT
jgi:hypothetical protein